MLTSTFLYRTANYDYAASLIDTASQYIKPLAHERVYRKKRGGDSQHNISIIRMLKTLSPFVELELNVRWRAAVAGRQSR